MCAGRRGFRIRYARDLYSLQTNTALVQVLPARVSLEPHPFSAGVGVVSCGTFTHYEHARAQCFVSERHRTVVLTRPP